MRDAIQHSYQRSRYELKYLIDEPRARQVRDFIRSYLHRDVHSIPDMHFSYPIYTMYLDDPGLALYHATVQAQKNRFKLRVRYYDHNEKTPLFCEIKRRVNDVIIKHRALIQREAMERLLAGWPPRMGDLHDASDGECYSELCEFVRLRSALHAEPKVIIYFEREAWISPDDDNLRVTFDRKAAVARYDHTLQPAKWADAKLNEVILELKFDDRFPTWMRELVQCCDLHRTRMGKYVHCTDQLPHAPRPYVHLYA